MPARYYRRRRKMPLLLGYEERPDGSQAARLSDPVPALTTRWYFGLRRRKPHNVYYFGGTWYRARARALEVSPSGEVTAWTHVLEPIDAATCADRFAAQTLEQGRCAPVTLEIRDGRAVRAKGYGPAEGMELLDGSEPTDYLEALLDLSA